MKEITSEIAKALQAHFASDDVREVVAETKNATDTGTFRVVITTENLDRYDEVISLDGWELEHYMKNPVVLWGHDHNTLPVGVATSVYRDGNQLVAEGKFAPHEHAQTIRGLYDDGILRAASVGFIAKEREGNLITKAELIEFSFVSVPANPYALALALKKERSVDELITKGIFQIETKELELEEEIETEEEEDSSGEKDGEEPANENAEMTDEQKALADHIVKAVLAALKDGALEEETPERADDEGDEADPEVKEFELKRMVQNLDTYLGDYLAEKRQDTHRS